MSDNRVQPDAPASEGARAEKEAICRADDRVGRQRLGRADDRSRGRTHADATSVSAVELKLTQE